MTRFAGTKGIAGTISRLEVDMDAMAALCGNLESPKPPPPKPPLKREVTAEDVIKALSKRPQLLQAVRALLIQSEVPL